MQAQRRLTGLRVQVDRLTFPKNVGTTVRGLAKLPLVERSQVVGPQRAHLRPAALHACTCTRFPHKTAACIGAGIIIMLQPEPVCRCKLRMCKLVGSSWYLLHV